MVSRSGSAQVVRSGVAQVSSTIRVVTQTVGLAWLKCLSFSNLTFRRREIRPDDDLVEGDESLTLNGTVGNAAAGSVTLAIEDRTVITRTLLGPAGSTSSRAGRMS